MQRVLEKIIEKLRDKSLEYDNKANDEMIENGHTLDFEHCSGRKAAYEDAIKIVNQVTSEYGGGWIPVSERLPENNKVVLCWVRSTTIASGETYIIGSCDCGFWFLQTYEIGHHHFPVKDYEVVAWQPLPIIYKSKKKFEFECMNPVSEALKEEVQKKHRKIRPEEYINE